MALNTARVYSATSKPATSQVGRFLDLVAGRIDSMLVEKGYVLPVPTAASSAILFLAEINALGAWAKVESAAEASPHVDDAVAAYGTALDMLASARNVLDIPKQQTRSSPRGPGLTTPNGVDVGGVFDPNDYDTTSGQTNPRDPYFSRTTRF